MNVAAIFIFEAIFLKSFCCKNSYIANVTFLGYRKTIPVNNKNVKKNQLYMCETNFCAQSEASFVFSPLSFSA